MERLWVGREILVAGSHKVPSGPIGGVEIPDPQKKSKIAEFQFLILLFILETNDSNSYNSGRYMNLVSISKKGKNAFILNLVDLLISQLEQRILIK
jgi:hypothetical protein